MNTLRPGESHSIWQDTVEMSRHPALRDTANVDICVVGGGIGGLTTAYLLLKEGKSVCLLESYELCSGQTGKTTAHFSTALDDRYFDIEKIHGAKGSKLAYESHAAAIKKVQEIANAEGINCDLEKVSGYLFAGTNDSREILEKELSALRRAGMMDAQILNSSPFLSFNVGACLHTPNQMQLHPLKYCEGLAQKILAMGGKIFTHTHVVEIHGGGDCYVKTKEGLTVHCSAIVVATNTPINDTLAIHTKQAAYRSYVVGFQIPKNSIAKALYWDTEDPYHYMRVDSTLSAYDILIVGGEDHKTGQEDDPKSRYSAIEAWTRARFPVVDDVEFRWSGQVMEPVDGLAFLGHNPMDKNNVYVISGDSGNGMTHCTIGAMLITDQIMGRENAWEKLYSPSRISLKAGSTFIRENANVAAQYGDWLIARETPIFDEMKNGEGVVFRNGMGLVAAYKDDGGNMEFMSASCTHLSGVVSWNAAEKSWDCPCHGARYDCHGKVIEGPAFEDLKAVEIENDTLTPVEESLRQERLRMNERLYPATPIPEI